MVLPRLFPDCPSATRVKFPMRWTRLRFAMMLFRFGVGSILLVRDRAIGQRLHLVAGVRDQFRLEMRQRLARDYLDVDIF